MKLLVGYIGKGNFGDEIILKEYLSQNTSTKFIVYSYGLHYENSNVCKMIFWSTNKSQNIINFIKTVVKCNEVEWIGGTCFSDEDGIGGFNYMILAVLFFRRINYLYVGINQLKKKKSRFKAKLLLFFANRVLLRDKESLVNAKPLISKGKYDQISKSITEDLGGIYLEKNKVENPTSNNTLLIAWRDLEGYVSSQKTLINDIVVLIKKSMLNYSSIVIIDGDDSLDFRVSNVIYKELLDIKLNNIEVLYKKNIRLEDKTKMIQSARTILTSRLHVAMAGVVYNKSVFAFEYSNKMKYQLKNMNCTLFSHSDIINDGFSLK